MERIQGVVSDLRLGKTVMYKKETGTSTLHAAVFKVGERQCKIVANHPIVIEEGDEVILSGAQRSDNLFIALAHRNVTRRVEGHEGWATRLVLTVLLVAAGIWLGAVLLGGSYALVLTVALLGSGVLMGWRSVQVVLSILALRPQGPRKPKGKPKGKRQ